MGELHLEVLVDRMKREFKVEANVGKPQVAYRETITKPVAKVEYTHKKQTGGSGQFAGSSLHVEPNRSRWRYLFENKVTGGRIPREYIPSVDAGCQEAMRTVFSLAIPWSMSRSLSSTARTTTSTRRNWRSRSPDPWLQGRPPRQAGAPLEPMMAVEVDHTRGLSWATSSVI